MDDFLTALGLMLLFEGIPYFAWPKRMRQWVLSIAGMPDGLLRKSGLLMMLAGLGVVYLVRG